MSRLAVTIVAVAACVAVGRGAQGPPPAETGAPVDTASFAHSRPLAPVGAGLVLVPLDAHVLAHSRGRHGRLSDLRIVDEEGRQVPYIVEEHVEPLKVELALEPLAEAPDGLRQSSGQQSLYGITLPYAGLGGMRLAFDTKARVFDRRVQIAVQRPPDRRHRDPWLDVLADTRWSHADPDIPAPALAVRLREIEETALLLVVHEGDNSALSLSASRLELPAYWLRFRHPGDASLRLMYGQPALGTPQYDMALRREELLEGEARTLTLGDVSASAGAASDEVSQWPRGIFWVALAGAVLALLALITRLVRAG